MHRLGRRLIVSVGSVALILSVAGYLVLESRTEADPVLRAAPTEPAPSKVDDAVPPSRGTAAAGNRRERAPRPGVPTKVVIPELGVSASVQQIEMNSDRNDPKYRTLVPPGNPATVGWWRDGPRPGAGRGSALILGHTKKIPGVAGIGEGAFGRLSRLRSGDRIALHTDKGPLHYRVTEVRADVDRKQVARDAVRIDDRDFPGGRLVLITCWYDGNRFSGNTFVFARPEPA